MMLLRALSGIASLIPATVYAALPQVPCLGLAGCGNPPAGNVLAQNLPHIAMLLLQIAGGIAVFFVVWNGIQMIVFGYDTGKAGGYRYGVIYALVGLGLSASAQLIVGWALTGLSGVQAGGNVPILILASGVNFLYAIMNATFVLSVLHGAFRMVMAQGQQDQYNAGRSAIFWSIIGAIVVNSAAFLVRTISIYFNV